MHVIYIESAQSIVHICPASVRNIYPWCTGAIKTLATWPDHKSIQLAAHIKIYYVVHGEVILRPVQGSVRN